MVAFNAVVFCIIWVTSYSFSQDVDDESVQIQVETKNSISTTKDYFVSYTLDTSDFYQNPPMNLTDKDFQYMAKQLAPAVLRVGGGACDKSFYFNDIKTGQCENIPHGDHCFTKDIFDGLMDFIDGSDAKLVFCISLQEPYNASSWNSTNAEFFLNYIVNNGYSDKFYGFELGNEVNHGGTVGPEWQVSAFKKLKKILTGLNYTKPLIFGPDASGGPGDYDNTFIKSICDEDIIDLFTYHCYVGVNATGLLTLDGINKQYDRSVKFNKAVAENCPKWKMDQIIAGEIGEHDDGGTNGTTNRFIDSFWYLDAFGTISKLGQGAVFRQQLWGLQYHPFYSLLNTPQFIPLPDYWVAVLFNGLVGSVVLNVTASDEYLRVYGFCSDKYDGSVVLVYINLKDELLKVQFDDNVLGKSHLDYFITSNETNNALDTTNISLNGIKLMLNKDHTLPELKGSSSSSNPIQIYKHSLGFIHFVDVKADVCQHDSIK